MRAYPASWAAWSRAASVGSPRTLPVASRSASWLSASAVCKTRAASPERHVVSRGRRQPARVGDGLDLHAVLRQRAGLVGADHRHRAQRFHRCEPPHEGLPRGHAPGAHGQGHRHDGRKRLGNRRDGEGDRREQHEHRRLAAQQSHAEDDAAQHEHGDGEQSRQPRQPALKRRLSLLLLLEHLRDAPELRRHAGGDRHPRSAPVHDHRALVGQVEALADRQDRRSATGRCSSRPVTTHRSALTRPRAGSRSPPAASPPG